MADQFRSDAAGAPILSAPFRNHVLKSRYIFAVLLCLMVLCAGQVYGQSVLDFPRVISSSDSFTGIAIGNATSQQASVTFTAYLPDGSRFAAGNVTNPVTITLPAGAQHARLF